MEKQIKDASTYSSNQQRCRSVLVRAAAASLVTTLVVIELTLLVKTKHNSPTNSTCIEPETCGEMADILYVYLNKTINTRYDTLVAEEEKRREERQRTKPMVALKNVLAKTYWRMSPSARVIGDFQVRGQALCGSNIMCEDDLQPILFWNHTPSAMDFSVFLRNGIKYRDGSLVVPVNGTYYVYSCLDVYEPVHKMADNTDRPPFKHAVYRYNILETSEEELVMTSHTHRDSGWPVFNMYNSRVESVLRLRAGDELSVKVSNVSYLKYPSLNYFGVKLI